jgi:hypothetical protein
MADSEFEERNITAAWNLCDEWWFIVFRRSLDLRQCFQKDFR